MKEKLNKKSSIWSLISDEILDFLFLVNFKINLLYFKQFYNFWRFEVSSSSVSESELSWYFLRILLIAWDELWLGCASKIFENKKILEKFPQQKLSTKRFLYKKSEIIFPT